jgi:hypothetical protein
MNKYGKIKAFRLQPELNGKFIEECKSIDVNQSVIIELLIIRWLQLRNKTDKTTANIYKNG